jgi:hypothetical protein
LLTLNDKPKNPQFPPAAICTTCGHPFESLPSSPPTLPPGSRFAAAFAQYISARTEYFEDCRRAGEAMRGKLDGAASAAGGVR